jgi:hypothetical protein
MNGIQSFLFGIGLALLVNVPIWLNKRRLLRLAKARLEVSKVVTAMDNLMLNGKLKVGDTCHDKLYHVMLRAQYENKTYWPWKFWIPPTPKSRASFKRLHKELLEKGTCRTYQALKAAPLPERKRGGE